MLVIEAQFLKNGKGDNVIEIVEKILDLKNKKVGKGFKILTPKQML